MLTCWLIVLLVTTNVLSRPNELNNRGDSISNSDVTESTLAPTQRVPETTDSVQGIEKIATVARASSNDHSLSPIISKEPGDDSDHPEQMVEKDTRTPPKLKDIIKEVKNTNATLNESKIVVDKIEANGRFELAEDSSEGKASKKGEIIKGVAVPVIMDEDLQTATKKLQKIPNPQKTQTVKDDKKKVTTSKVTKEPLTTTTPSSGLSTWILLSDNNAVTQPTTKSSKKSTNVTTKKPKIGSTTPKLASNNKSNSKKNPTKTEQKKTETVLETMVKNQKKPSGTLRTKNKDNIESKTETSNVLTTTITTIDITEKIDAENVSNDSNVETTTKGKTSSKKRKKNKKKKPSQSNTSNQEVKDVVKQPVGAQFYNFLSREIMPTVGIGLVGVLVTAGLAGLLGYNPFINANLPIRRTYENQHGYSPNSYYSYPSEYGDGDSGQAEEVLFREVLSGMPENSRYGLKKGDTRYPDDQYYHKTDQMYESSIKSTEKPESSYSSLYGYDSYQNEKFPSYANAAYRFSDSSTSEKYHATMKLTTEGGKFETQPEAIYQVSGTEDENHSWHRIGSPLEQSHVSAPEPGPRRLNLDEMTKSIVRKHSVAKRSVEFKPSVSNGIDLENEIDGVLSNSQKSDIATSTLSIDTTTESSTEVLTTTEAVPNLNEYKKNETDPITQTEEGDVTNTTDSPSFIEVLKKVANFKLRLGISVLKTTADAFSRYLDGVLKRVDDSMVDSEVATKRSWFAERFLGDEENDVRVREKRFRRDTNKKSKYGRKKAYIQQKTKQLKDKMDKF